MFTICFNSFIFVLQVAFVLKRSIPLVRGNQMHRVLTDTAKKMMKNYQEQWYAHTNTHTRVERHKLSRVARSCKTIKCLKMKNHVFKTNSLFQSLSLWHRANIRLMGTSFRNNRVLFNSKENAACNRYVQFLCV